MISIVLAVYNGERFLNECLDSLRNQTLRDMRFILVDDGSTDSSGQICEEYAANDPRFLVVHTENKGLCKARETGIGIAASVAGLVLFAAVILYFGRRKKKEDQDLSESL